jgi:thiol:disulfide interchange protein DsbA
MEKGSKKTIYVLLVLCALFLGLVQPGNVDSKEMSLLAFGNGKINVRLYSDYFCGPCSALEPKIEYPILDLVRRNIITVTFVDTPFYKYSSLYARYFLYVLNEKKELRHALTARAALFEAAKANINEQEKLEAFLRTKGTRFKPFDAKPVFNMLQGYLREDKINSTPSCVIRNGDKKEVYTGGENIIKALEALK